MLSELSETQKIFLQEYYKHKNTRIHKLIKEQLLHHIPEPITCSHNTYEDLRIIQTDLNTHVLFLRHALSYKNNTILENYLECIDLRSFYLSSLGTKAEGPGVIHDFPALYNHHYNLLFETTKQFRVFCTDHGIGLADRDTYTYTFHRSLPYIEINHTKPLSQHKKVCTIPVISRRTKKKTISLTKTTPNLEFSPHTPLVVSVDDNPFLAQLTRTLIQGTSSNFLHDALSLNNFYALFSSVTSYIRHQGASNPLMYRLLGYLRKMAL